MRNPSFPVIDPDLRERLRVHGVALLIVAAAALGISVTGLTAQGVPFTVFALAVALAAGYGGALAGLVASLATVLAANAVLSQPVDTTTKVMLAIGGSALAWLVGTIATRRRDADSDLQTVEGANRELQRRDRQARAVDAALRHLEEMTSDTAVVGVNTQGLITEWRNGAERVYGYTADDVLGLSAEMLFATVSGGPQFAALLTDGLKRGSVRRPDVHVRKDGTRFHVDVELKAFREGGAAGFTLAVRDLARDREWAAYREAAIRAQAALQDAADEARRQLEALENLTDPTLNPLAGPDAVNELLDRLRAILGADGIALVHRLAPSTRLATARGLQPVADVAHADTKQRAPASGRVAVVHNDPERVEQVSSLQWPEDVSSLMVVPVTYNGRVWSTIEVVNERPRRATDWDVALVRIVADRLSSVVVRNDARLTGVA